jgi:hypothetical protein
VTALASDPIREVLAHLPDAKKSGNGWMAKCPAHEDRRASLSISAGDNGAVLIRCHAGCSIEAICDRMGLAVKDLFPPRESHRNNGAARKIVAEYDYLNAAGDLIYQTVRYSPKDFRQRRPDGKGGWLWNLDGVPRVPYRLIELRESGPDEQVYICEGEKDCDRLASIGLVATCNVGGAGKWKPEYNEGLRDRRVCIIADKDGAGRKHAQQVAASLAGIARDVRIMELPGDGVKDASDYLNAGGTAEALVSIAEAAPVWTPETVPPDESKPEPRSVREMMRIYPHLRPPVIHGLLRRGETMNIIAPPKTGKSWLAIDLAIAIATGRMWLGQYQTETGDVLVLDNELHGETCAARIPKVAAARGVLVDEFADRIYVETMRGRLRNVYGLGPYFESIALGKFRVVVLDAFYRFLPPDADENSNAAMAGVYSYLDSIADRIGCCFVLIHHSTKGTQAEKAITDVGAGAGAQSRATDTHLILRQHEVDGVVVLDAAVRSWPPVDPVCLRWEYPIWHPAPELDPTALRRPGRQRKRVEDTEPSAPAPDPWTPERFAAEFIADTPREKQTIIARASLREISSRMADSCIRIGLADGLIHRWAYPKDRGVYLANIAQPVTATAGGAQ